MFKDERWACDDEAMKIHGIEIIQRSNLFPYWAEHAGKVFTRLKMSTMASWC